MAHLDFLIRDLALILVVAGITTLIFKRIKQPLVLGYILAGFLTSANFSMLPTILDVENINVWGELGVIFIMFALGLEFSFHKIAHIGGSAIVTAATVISAMVLIGYGVGFAMGWGRMDSIFLGGMLSMSSTMIILKAYEELGLKSKKYAQLVLGTLIIEDIVAIFMMIVLSALAVSKDLSGLDLMGDIGKLLLYLILWLLLGFYLIPTALKRADKYLNDETLLIVSLGLCLAMVVIANYMGFSSALGAFLAGSILASTVKAEKIEGLIKPIKDLFGAVFFTSVGMLVNPELIVQYIGPIIILTIVTIFGQMIFSGIGVLLSGQPLHTAVGASMSMVQVGEFSFIIASLGTSLGVTGDFLYPIVVSVSVITTFTTPMFIRHTDSVYVIISRHLPRKTLKTIKNYTSDKQTENEKDADWQEFLGGYIPRTALTMAVLLCIYMLGTQILLPMLCNYGIGLKSSRWIAVAITVICMTPMINMMSYRGNTIFTKLWLKNNSNRLPLIVFKSFRVFMSVFFVMLTINTITGIPAGFLWVMALVIVGFSIKSNFMTSNSIKMETRFVSNFNERILAETVKKRGVSRGYRWLDETLLVEEYKVNKILNEESDKSFYVKQRLGTQIIKIIRDGEHINIPGLETDIREGDVIVALGKSNNLDSYKIYLKKIAEISQEKKQVSLRDYTYRQVFISTDTENHLLCIAINITSQCEFCGKTIHVSGVKEKYGGFVIGIDRKTLPLVSPNKNTVVEEGDILWVLGSPATADKMIQAGLLKYSGRKH